MRKRETAHKGKGRRTTKQPTRKHTEEQLRSPLHARASTLNPLKHDAWSPWSDAWSPGHDARRRRAGRRDGRLLDCQQSSSSSRAASSRAASAAPVQRHRRGEASRCAAARAGCCAATIRPGTTSACTSSGTGSGCLHRCRDGACWSDHAGPRPRRPVQHRGACRCGSGPALPVPDLRSWLASKL